MSLAREILLLLVKVLTTTILAYLFLGNVQRTQLGLLLVLLMVLLAGPLWREWRKPRPGDPRWMRAERLAAANTWWEERTAVIDAQDALPETGDPRPPTESELEAVLARPGWREEFARRHARRHDADLFLEALCLGTVPIGGLVLALMWSSPVVAWSGSDRGPAAIGLAASISLHLAINLLPASRVGWRVRARLALLAAVFLPAVLVAKERHPYLLAVGKDHRRLLAERVWNLGLDVVAGRHADALIAYARDLEEERRWADAAVVYDRAIVLDAFSREAHEGMARVREAQGDHAAAAASRVAALQLAAASSNPPTPPVDAESPDPEAVRLPAFDWRAAPTLHLCLIPAGEVPDALLDEAGRRLAETLRVPVFRWAGPPVALPAPGRRSALLGGSQWVPAAVMDAFVARMRDEERQGHQARGAWQFIVVTDADLYLPGSNFVYGVQYPVHGIVSFARMNEDGDKRLERLAKQLVSTAIKCFGVRPAARPDCVTSYIDSLEEFDRKPIRAAPETWAEYRRRVQEWEADPSRNPPPPL